MFYLQNKIKCVTGLLFYKIHFFCFELNTGRRGEAVVRALDSHQFGLGSGLAMYAIYGLGTGDYLLPEGGGEFLGVSLDFWENKRGISRN